MRCQGCNAEAAAGSLWCRPCTARIDRTHHAEEIRGFVREWIHFTAAPDQYLDPRLGLNPEPPLRILHLLALVDDRGHPTELGQSLAKTLHRKSQHGKP